MITAETFQQMNCLHEPSFWPQVKSLIEAKCNDINLAPLHFHIFHYDCDTGEFQKLEVIENKDAGSYTDEYFISDYKRLFITHNGKGLVYIYMDGRQVRTLCHFKNGQWYARFYDCLSRPLKFRLKAS